MKYKILALLKEKGDYVSGEDLAKVFGVSRAAIWKNISKLKDEGYNIASVSNKGYLLEGYGDILNEFEIGHKCVYKQEVTSTNDVAKELARKGCEDWLVVLADKQVGGKGRLGRVWEAEKGQNIALSVVLRPNISPVEAPQLTLITGIAVARAIKKVCGCEPKIKWPNDIILNGKKIVGILTEISAEIEHINYVVVGIGVNVNQEKYDGELSKKATSLFIENNKKYRRSDIIRVIIDELSEIYNRFLNENGFACCREEYLALCVNVGKEAKAIYRNKEICGRVIDINKNGELILKTEAGEEVIIYAGEVSLRTSDNQYI